MSAVVFLGPSLGGEIATSYGLIVRPPAQMGDIYRAVLDGATVIGIVDGFFERTPAVWHKEVLFALAHGVHVIGGASMGALRAAELDVFGMRGIGRIYRDFATGLLEDDDEVAVVHASAEDGYTLLSEAMVNIRYALEAARIAGVIDPATCERLLSFAKATFYPERNWQSIFDHLEAFAGNEAGVRLRRFIEAEDHNQKRDDAIETIRVVADVARLDAPMERPNFDFEPTIYWERAILERSGTIATAGADTRQLINYVRAFDPQRRVLRERGLLHHLVNLETARRNLSENSALAMERFRVRRGLHSSASLLAWMDENQVTRRECLALARQEARVDAISQEWVREVDACIPNMLKLDGLFAQMTSIVAEAGSSPSSGLQIGPAFQGSAATDAALALYASEFGQITGSLEEHIGELGLRSVREFIDTLVARYPVEA